jgi:hypothetical protein
MYVDSTSWARDVKAVTSDSSTAKAGAVDAWSDDVRFWRSANMRPRDTSGLPRLERPCHPLRILPYHIHLPFPSPYHPFHTLHHQTDCKETSTSSFHRHTPFLHHRKEIRHRAAAQSETPDTSLLRRNLTISTDLTIWLVLTTGSHGPIQIGWPVRYTRCSRRRGGNGIIKSRAEILIVCRRRRSSYSIATSRSSLLFPWLGSRWE